MAGFLVKLAFDYANNVHCNQKDKAGEPYMNHIFAVAKVVADRYGYESTEHLVAILHDVLEGAEKPYVCAGEIYHLFGPAVLASLLAISKRKGETYFGYVMRVKADKVATAVKIVDIGHNMQTDRITKIRPLTPKEEEKQRLYRFALEILHA